MVEINFAWNLLAHSKRNAVSDTQPTTHLPGLGTSAIGQYSFNWSESMTAATLAVGEVNCRFLLHMPCGIKAAPEKKYFILRHVMMTCILDI